MAFCFSLLFTSDQAEAHRQKAKAARERRSQRKAEKQAAMFGPDEHEPKA